MTPNLRYSFVYFAFNLANAVTVAFFPLHTNHLGFSPLQIALAAALPSLGTLIGAPAFASLSHHKIPPRRILLACVALSCLVYVPLVYATSFPSIMLLWSIFVILNSGTIVMIDTSAVHESAMGVIRFERVRMWGSIGFMASIALVGLGIDLFGVPSIIFFGLGFVCLTFCASIFLLPRLGAETGRTANPADAAVISEPSPLRGLKWILISVALIWASHGAFYTYFSIYARELNWSGTLISTAWNLGVFSEIILFIFFGRVVERWSLPSILKVSAFFTVVRWCVVASSTSAVLLVVVQILHALSFGAVYLSSIRLVQQSLPPAFRSRGQGLLTGFGSGAGSLSGRIAFGLIANRLQDRDFYLLFWGAAAMAALGTLAALRVGPPPDRELKS